MSRRQHLLAFSLLFLTCIPGCDSGGSADGGRVAVVDLKQVSDQLGRTAQLQQTLVNTQQQMQVALQQLQEQIQRDVNARTAALGPVPKPEEVQKLEAMKANARQLFDQQVAASQDKINRLHAEFAAKLREDVRFVALRVAQKRGRSVVVVREAVIDFDPEADITGAVIQEMKSIGAALPPVTPGQVPATQAETTAPSTQPAPLSPFSPGPH